ncbi:hypothetical protein OIU76_029039 [Salix suchowensis]|nr:hypothetical protein OIU76_029039 [Salix suchowensis]
MVSSLMAMLASLTHSRNNNNNLRNRKKNSR